MNQNDLCVSFWNIDLANLPEGPFTRRAINAQEAKRQIEDAQKAGRLFCVSDDDLLAPYNEREHRNHEALCRVLEETFGISLALKDFFFEHGEGDDVLYFTNPLCTVEVSLAVQLLVVTCSYALDIVAPHERLIFTIDPNTVEFHLFASA
jgi:hypothetical protein